MSKSIISLTSQQQMQRRQCMCQQRCRQMLISNCIIAERLNNTLDSRTCK